VRCELKRRRLQAQFSAGRGGMRRYVYLFARVTDPPVADAAHPVVTYGERMRWNAEFFATFSNLPVAAVAHPLVVHRRRVRLRRRVSCPGAGGSPPLPESWRTDRSEEHHSIEACSRSDDVTMATIPRPGTGS
jgi:hypothetical protein